MHKFQHIEDYYWKRYLNSEPGNSGKPGNAGKLLKRYLYYRKLRTEPWL